MGNRLSKIYTRTGDDGTTGLGDGSRVEKDGLRVAAYGTTDELNSVIGMVRAHPLPEQVEQVSVKYNTISSISVASCVFPVIRQ